MRDKLLNDIKRIAVVGAGTMGSGIAQLCAQAGFETIIFDLVENSAARGKEIINSNLSIAVDKHKISKDEKDKILSRLKVSAEFIELKADLIIEAIVEDLSVKSKLFIDLSMINDGNTIFCTNTSSIPITKIAESIPHPERIAGMHFFNPAHLMMLVEIISGEKTSPKIINTVFELAKKLGKVPVKVKDSPGFIVNRIGKLYHTEPLKILEDNMASIETIDRLLESTGFKMGPFKLIDLIGVDSNLNVTKSLYDLFDHHPKFKPSNLQKLLVDSRFLGKKTGRGFYRY
ncbi:MAG: 3-hydroxyacyl-CoA dehydrogenase NAD-binding domain-containing protein [Chitinophagales bacterium]